MNSEKLLKLQYSLTQFLYWVACCACSGFVAVYLQHKGLSNTYIGLVVGVYGILSLIAQPICSQMIQRIPILTVRKLMMILLILSMILFWGLAVLMLSKKVAIVIFVLVNVINSCTIPLLNALGMEYINHGIQVNYGLARGFGSLGWAVSAVFTGVLLEKFTPDILGYIYVISAGLLWINISFMSDYGQHVNQTAAEQKEKGFLQTYLKDVTFLLIVLGSFFNLVCHSLCTTYTINIVRNVGGNEAAAGLAQFFGAGSEMIGMAIFGMVIHKYGSIRMLKISSVFYALRFIFLIFAENLPMVMIGYALQGPSAGFYVPAAVYFVNEKMQPRHRTQGQTMYNVLTVSAANLVGNLLGGRLLDQFGLHYTLVVCAVFASVGCICIITRKNQKVV